MIDAETGYDFQGMSELALDLEDGDKKAIAFQQKLTKQKNPKVEEECSELRQKSGCFEYKPIDMRVVMRKWRENNIHKRSQKIVDFCRFIAPSLHVEIDDNNDFKAYDFSNSFKHIYSLKEQEQGKEKKCKMICFYCQDEDKAKEQGVESFDFIASTNFNYFIDLYVTKNSFFRDERGNDKLFCFDNIVIDIDNHDNDITQSAINKDVNKLIRALKKLRDNNRFMKFNAVKTGRGVQIWVHLESFSAIKDVMQKLYVTFCEKFCEIVESVIAENRLKIKVDRTPSTSISGFMRLPYTYNTKIRQRNGKFYKTQLFQYTQRKYSLDELCAFFGIKRSNGNKKIVKSKKFRPCPQSDDAKSFVGLFYKRKIFLERLVQRDAVNEGRRNAVMYCYYISCYKIFSAETAQQLTIALNNSLKKPLPKAELNATFRSAEKKIWDMTNATMFEKINATKAEIQLYNEPTDKQKERKEKQENARKEKEKRNQTIRELSEQGVSVKEIASQVNCCKDTVCKFKADKQQQVDYNKIIELYKQGLKQKEIARQVNCAESTVSEVLKPYKTDKKEVIIKLFQQGLKQSEIIRQTGYSKNTVAKILKEYKVKI